MQFLKTTLTVLVVVWSVLTIEPLQASPEEKRIDRSNRGLDHERSNEGLSRESRAANEDPTSIDHLSRRKRAAATAAERKEILDLHNSYRQNEGASDMYYLRWNVQLASMAETWATGCNFVHGQPKADISSLGYIEIGQNLHIDTGVSINLTSAIKGWFDEKPNFNYETNSCPPGKKCGHYRQIVWSESFEIGCAYTRCPVLAASTFKNALYLVCNYGPGVVNAASKEPYQKGAACSSCSSGQYYCRNGLCDKTCSRSGPNCVCSAACQHCGNVTRDCRCKCTVGWFGNDCSKECKNNDARCGANPGISAKMCSTHTFASDLCPAMCGKCVAGTPPPCPTKTKG